MNQTRITMCPKCDTTFRVSPAQLKLAKGAVRCGACLHVFYAEQHFQQSATPEAPALDDRTQDLFQSPEIKKPQPKQAQPNKPQQKASLFESNDTTLQDALQTIKDHEFYIDDDINTNHPVKKENPNAPIASNVIDDLDDFLIDDHIDDDLDLINDSESERKSSESHISQEFLSLSNDNIGASFFSEEEAPHRNISVEENNEEEAWAQALLDEDEEDTQKASAPENTTASTESFNSYDHMPFETDTAFNHFQEDPLELNLPQAGRKKKLRLWFLASTLLICTLAAQAAYFNFSLWARLDNLRPWYEVACNQLSCTLPSTYDVARIHTTASPQVSTHPRFHNALMIDILFINSAQYPQAFPRLELTFSDQNETVIAHRL